MCFYFSSFCGFVNYFLKLDEDSLHRNTVAVKKEPIRTISEKFTVLALLCVI